MNLTTLQYFIDVYDLRSFSRAAEKNYVSQTAISIQMKALEEELNVMLFSRNQKPILPTEQGDFLYRHVIEIINMWNFTTEAIQEIANRPLRFTYSMHGGGILLSDLISKIDFDIFPKKFTFLPLKDSNSLEMIKNHRADLAIIEQHELRNLSKEFVVEKLFHMTYFLAVNHKHPLAVYSEVTLDNLDLQQLIILKTVHSQRNKNFIRLFDYLNSSDYDFSNNITAPDFQTMLLYVLENNGIAIIPSHVNTNIRSSNIKLIPLRNLSTESSMYLTGRKEHQDIIKNIVEIYHNYEDNLFRN